MCNYWATNSLHNVIHTSLKNRNRASHFSPSSDLFHVFFIKGSQLLISALFLCTLPALQAIQKVKIFFTHFKWKYFRPCLTKWWWPFAKLLARHGKSCAENERFRPCFRENWVYKFGHWVHIFAYIHTYSPGGGGGGYSLTNSLEGKRRSSTINSALPVRVTHQN